jgi:uncharacterized membrane protein
MGWVDVLRGLAVVGMIWTHCANTFLTAELQATPAYGWASYFHGLIAPTFFWLAGWVRGVASLRNTQKSAWPAVKRLLMIYVLGHLLHVPWAQWMSGDFSVQTWRVFLQADVLQCLAISSLLLVALERAGRWSMAIVIAMLVAAVALTDVLRQTQTGWLIVDAYLNREQGSLFPLFPWFAFAAAGYVSGRLALSCTMMLVTGGSTIALVWLVVSGHSTPSFFVERLAWVLALAGLVRALQVAGPGWLLLMGRQSLSAYVVHMLLIYMLPLGSAGPLSVVLGMNQSLPAVVGWFLLVGALTFGVLEVLARCKSKLDTR